MPCTVGVQTLVVPHTSGESKLVVPHTVTPVKLPLNVTGSLNSIALPPVFELNASAYTIPDALILPDTVRASFGVPVFIPIASALASRYNNLLFEPPAPLNTISVSVLSSLKISLLTSASFCHAYIKFTPPATISILSPVGNLI